ncbi:MAG TPA: DUF4129 domain-containing protein [Acidobacteriaceae bacterium]
MLPCSKFRLLSGLVLLLLLSGTAVSAQSVAIHTTGKFEKQSMQQFRDRLASMQALVETCTASGTACDAGKVGLDERIEVPAAQTFQVRWRWLRDALDQSRTAKPAERTQLMRQSSLRLAEMLRENGQPESAAQFPTARKDADRILAGSEFSEVEQQSWLDRIVAKFWLAVERGLSSFSAFGNAMPWIGRLLEFLLFGGAAVGLLFFVRRSLQRQRLAVAFNAQSTELAWGRESNDWAAQGEASARAGDWRDAVHCLYWATIVMLEGRRAWRHNPARTPREYVRLLKSGSAQQGALRGLTQIFERLWYGLRDADAADYQRARGFYDNLRDNSRAGAA